MSEINQPATGERKRKGVRRSKKNATRIDLTPMVDLGFLLITFFIFSTTISKPKSMKMELPADAPDRERNVIGVSGVLTLMLGNDDKIFYYERDDPKKMKAVSFPEARSVLIDKKRRTPPADFMVILKAGKEATFGNTIHILDEMVINEVKRYAFVDASNDEEEIMHKMEVNRSN